MNNNIIEAGSRKQEAGSRKQEAYILYYLEGSATNYLDTLLRVHCR